MGITYTACQLCMATHGGGRHIWDVTYEEYNTFYYYGTIDKFVFYVTVGLVKISLTLFIRRLADRASRKWRWFCDIFLVTLVLYIAAAIFWEVFNCTPARAQWDKYFAGMIVHPATCQPTSIAGVQNLFFNITHVVQGVILLLSPMVILWKVQMDKHKKMRLFGMWTVGLIAVICGLSTYVPVTMSNTTPQFFHRVADVRARTNTTSHSAAAARRFFQGSHVGLHGAAHLDCTGRMRGHHHHLAASDGRVAGGRMARRRLQSRPIGRQLQLEPKDDGHEPVQPIPQQSIGAAVHDAGGQGGLLAADGLGRGHDPLHVRRSTIADRQSQRRDRAPRHHPGRRVQRALLLGDGCPS